jgi:AraC-like DNA-binding protein
LSHGDLATNLGPVTGEPKNATQHLYCAGRRLWIDNITRDLLRSVALERDIKELSVTGLTSNLAAARSLGPIAGSPAPSQIIRMLKIMDANITNSVRIKDIAAAAGLSRSHFSRAFLRTVGELPCGYLRRRRIELAQNLMLSTRKSLAEIALECGLCDQSHLTKSFRRVVGMSPSAWRRSQRGWASR